MSVGMDWGRRGYTCGRIADPPDAEWRDFEHETNELIVVLNGRLEIEIAVDGGVQRLDAMAGDEVFVPSGAKHTVRNVHTGITRWLYGYQEKNWGFRSL
jgi:mannose-6-phosphate isomerase-like protein (cupin superfamily)